MLSKTSSSGALEAFDRMEDKIEKMEAEAEVNGRFLAPESTKQSATCLLIFSPSKFASLDKSNEFGN